MTVAARLLATLSAWATCVAVTTVGAPMQDPAASPGRFSHAQHVDRVWLGDIPEVWRDCRACHRFDEQNRVSAPQRECDSCHVDKGLLVREFTVGWEDDLRGYTTRTRDAFRHHTHYMLECRECHLPPNARNVTDFDVVTGPGQCARCHEQRPAEEALAMVRGLRWFRSVADAPGAQALGVAAFTPPAADGYAQYADKLVKVFAGPDGGVNTVPLPLGGDFDHDDHAGITCIACHTTIPTASAKDVGTGQIPAGTCGSCHQIDDKTPPTAASPAAATRRVQRESQTAGAFLHADHYGFVQPGAQRRAGVCTEASYAQLTDSKQNGCDVCHVQNKAAVGLVQPDFPFQPGNSKHTYLDCASCHAVDGWRTGESAAKPLHDSSDGKQGDGKNGWGACAACHLPGAGAMAKERPKVDVQRFTESTFRFNAHTHPDITTAGVDRSGRAALADCAACHRARVPELPTRLAERVFRHATHLPAQPQAKDCAGCHPSATSAAAPAALAVDFRTYSTKDCTTCHWGGDVTEVVTGDGKPASRTVVQFPHGPHVKAGASCTDCHELDAVGRDETTKPAALQCNLCHDHQPGGDGKAADPKAEGLFAGEARSCVRCHHEPAPPGATLVEAVPPPRGTPAAAQDTRFRFEQAVFAGFREPQFHPLGGECKECHKADLAPNKKWPGLRRERKDHVFVRKPGKVHGDGPKQPANCLACHWVATSGLKASITGSGAVFDRRREPTSPTTRQEFGNEKTGYPGKSADG